MWIKIAQLRDELRRMLDDDLSDAVDRMCEEVCEEFGISDQDGIDIVFNALYN